jgi:radical SAM/Cys-rich protein
MHNMMPLLKWTDFPAINRYELETLQINMGYRCNQACLHCHVNASPKRKETMDPDTVAHVLAFLERSPVVTLDITGGAPELNPCFRELVSRARAMGKHVIDRCNLTILEEAGQARLARFLAKHQVEIIASLPCYVEQNVDRQRGDGVFSASIRALQRLNNLGYGHSDSKLSLHLVYNPIGPYLPPAQAQLEVDYKRELHDRFGIVFNQLYVIANMPIARFGSTLISTGEFNAYMKRLHDSHQDGNLPGVMCRRLISVDYQGFVYDCDFNQMLGIPLIIDSRPRIHLSDLSAAALASKPIQIADHCYGCTAGQGSSCGGALN